MYFRSRLNYFQSQIQFNCMSNSLDRLLKDKIKKIALGYDKIWNSLSKSYNHIHITATD